MSDTHKLMPVEPTEEMISAGMFASGDYRARVRIFYRAIFEAAPPSPDLGEGLRERVLKVLEPFAQFAERNCEPWDGTPLVMNLGGMSDAKSLTMGHLRAARSLLSEIAGETK